MSYTSLLCLAKYKSLENDTLDPIVDIQESLEKHTEVV